MISGRLRWRDFYLPPTINFLDFKLKLAPLDDAQMAVFADVSEALSCLDLRDDVSLDLLRQRSGSETLAHSQSNLPATGSIENP